MLNITDKTEANSIRFSLEGRLDANTAPQLETILKGAPTQLALVLDLEKLEYISSAGLRVFLSLQKIKKGAMKLIRVQPAVMEILEVTGFTDILEIE